MYIVQWAEKNRKKNSRTFDANDDARYLQECLDNLEGKGIHIDMEEK